MKEITKELIYGIHPIRELLKAKRRKLYTFYTPPNPRGRIAELIAQLPSYTHINYVSKEVLAKLTGSTEHQSVAGWVSPYQIRKKIFTPAKQSFLLLLDGIQDPKNLGAILRSAYCTGVKGVVLTQKGSAPLSAATLKASAGLAEHLEIYQASSAKHAVTELKEQGYQFYLATVDDSTRATEVLYKTPCCLVIGSEGTGISKSILTAGPHVTLPQVAADISYNASVAAGILLFIIATQQRRV